MSNLYNPVIIEEIDRKIVCGKENGIHITTDNKYVWSDKLHDVMLGNFWIPKEVSLVDDVVSWSTLSSKDKKSFKETIAFLIYLDSLQTSNLPNMQEAFTLSEIKMCISAQTFQESIHSKSYGYILESICDAEERRKIYDIAVTLPQLKERNAQIARLYDKFDPNNVQSILKACVANYALEGIYFYTGFAFFYSLARKGVMTGTATLIRYINKDELTHVTLFKNIITAIRAEYPAEYADIEDDMRLILLDACEAEKRWAQYAYDTPFDTYIEYITDVRLKALGMQPAYNIETNPLKWLERWQDDNGTKTDFFEEKVTNYAKGKADVNEVDNMTF